MNDVIEVSYTGDLLAHRRCSRAWAYESHAGFSPYEQVQAMEGRLLHHAMEWLTRQYQAAGKQHAKVDGLEAQLQHYFRVLWARGIRTAFQTKAETIGRVRDNLYPGGKVHPTVKAAIEGAQHTEYELRSVRKLFKPAPGGKQKLLLTGVLDLVVQQTSPLTYPMSFEWTDRARLEGHSAQQPIQAKTNDVEIWDYKGSHASTPYVGDYVRQLLTYAYLYRERTSTLPVRCVLFFVNEKVRNKQLLAIEVDKDLIERAVEWTHDEVAKLEKTIERFQKNPLAVDGGDRVLADRPIGERISEELRKQCTACGRRFDCREYRTHLKRSNHPDIDLRNVFKN